MKARLICTVLAVLLPILLLCGCSVQRLSLEEYRTEMESAFKGWSSSVVEWAAIYAEYVMINGEDGEYAAFQENKALIRQKLDVIDERLDAIEKVGLPPEEYDEMHRRLMSGVRTEREWLDYWYKACSANSETDFRSASGKAAEIATETEDTLPSVYMEMHMKLKYGDTAY